MFKIPGFFVIIVQNSFFFILISQISGFLVIIVQNSFFFFKFQVFFLNCQTPGFLATLTHITFLLFYLSFTLGLAVGEFTSFVDFSFCRICLKKIMCIVYFIYLLYFLYGKSITVLKLYKLWLFIELWLLKFWHSVLKCF